MNQSDNHCTPDQAAEFFRLGPFDDSHNAWFFFDGANGPETWIEPRSEAASYVEEIGPAATGVELGEWLWRWGNETEENVPLWMKNIGVGEYGESIIGMADYILGLVA